MTIKPGDTVADATTLPVGAVFKHTNHEYEWTVEEDGWSVCAARRLRCQTGDSPAIIISLPPADEPVELRTLAAGDYFEYAPSEFVESTALYGHALSDFARGLCQMITPGGLICKNRDGTRFEASGRRKVLRRPAPTAQPTKRPPCDVCGEESASNLLGAEFFDASIFGPGLGSIRLCAMHWGLPSGPVTDAVRARRAKTSGSGSVEHAESSPVVRKTPEPEDSATRWLGASPDRIPALEAVLAAQLAAGGVDTEYTRGRIVAREVALRELDRPVTCDREHSFQQDSWGKVWDLFTPVSGIQPGPLLHRSAVPDSQKALWRRR